VREKIKENPKLEFVLKRKTERCPTSSYPSKAKPSPNKQTPLEHIDPIR